MKIKTKNKIAALSLGVAMLVPSSVFAQTAAPTTTAADGSVVVQTTIKLYNVPNDAPWVVGDAKRIDFAVTPQIPDTYTVGVFLKDYYSGNEGLVAFVSPVPSTGNFNFNVPKLVLSGNDAVNLASSKYYVVLKLYNGKPCQADCTGVSNQTGLTTGTANTTHGEVNIISKATSEQPVTIFANAQEKFFIRAATDLTGEAGKSYSKLIEAVGSTGQVTWAVTSGSLPAGVSLVNYPIAPASLSKYCPQNDCAAFSQSVILVRGTPKTSGKSTATIQATDSQGSVTSYQFNFNIAPAGTTPDAQYGTVGMGYTVIQLQGDSSMYVVTKTGEKVMLPNATAAKPYNIKPSNVKTVDLLDFLSIPDAQFVRLKTSRTVYMLSNAKRGVMYPSALKRYGVNYRNAPELYWNHFYAFPDMGGVR